MFGFAEIILSQLEAQRRIAEQQFDEERLKRWLEGAPPEEHPRIRAEHAAAIEKRRQERETERRHRELCQAIRDAGQSAGRPYYLRGWY